jgi:hypothetical protein
MAGMAMFPRFLRLFSRPALLVWFFWGWALIEHLHTGQFALELLRSIPVYLNAHQFLVYGLGVVFLALVVTWPDLKKRLPSWLRLPKTPHEEIEGVWEGLRQAVDLQNQLAKQNGRLHENFAERIQGLEQDRTQAIEERYAIGARITSETGAITQRLRDFDSLYYGITGRLDEHKLWASDLERSINALKKSSAVALEETPGFSLFMIEITHLISQVDTAIGILLHIKRYRPESDTAKAPFSKNWCDAELSPRSDPLAIEWMLSVEAHLGACLDFSNTLDVAQSVVLVQSLGLIGSTWDQPMSMEDCESILQRQRDKLTAARADYAANFSARLARTVIS